MLKRPTEVQIQEKKIPTASKKLTLESFKTERIKPI